MLLWSTVASVYVFREQRDVLHNEITALEMMSSNLVNLEMYMCVGNIK